MDTERFGFAVARIDCISADPEDIIRKLGNHGIKLVIVRVDSRRIDLVNKLERMGFEMKDIQVTHGCDLENISFPENNIVPGVHFSDGSPEDQYDIGSIARQAFENYGHYAANKRLSPAKCNEIYFDWATRCLNDPDVADKTLVARSEKKTVGFLSFKTFQKSASLAVRGVIGAVSPEFRNRNIFRRLLLLGNQWAKESGLGWMEHNALLTNYPVNRTLARAGFKIERSFLTFHLWLDRP